MKNEKSKEKNEALEKVDEVPFLEPINITEYSDIQGAVIPNGGLAIESLEIKGSVIGSDPVKGEIKEARIFEVTDMFQGGKRRVIGVIWWLKELGDKVLFTEYFNVSPNMLAMGINFYPKSTLAKLFTDTLGKKESYDIAELYGKKFKLVFGIKPKGERMSILSRTLIG